jgi:hypothetical protein
VEQPAGCCHGRSQKSGRVKKIIDIKKLLNEPLAHFFVIGLLLFVLFGLVNNDSGRSAEEIVVGQGRISGLVANFDKTWQRPPTAEELQNMIDTWVREEILYREGIAIGFDLDDPVIRRRVAQKMTFIADGMVPDAPGDEELEDWLAANVSDYEIPAVYTLQQVYIDPQRHSDDLDVVANSIQGSLDDGADAILLGDSTLLPAEITSSSSAELARVFGAEFVSALAEMPVGGWQWPVRSGYGLHFVKIDEHIAAREPVLDEVRAAVVRDVLSDKSQKISEAFYAALRESYTVRIESVEQDD